MMPVLRTILAIAALAALAALPLLAACGDDDSSATPTRAATTAAATSSPAASTATSASSPSSGSGGGSSATTTAATAFTLTSGAFADNANIPVEYTCDGKSSSPALSWSGAPANTQAFALVMHDPDAPRAGGFTHWVVYNIPATATALPAAASPGGTLPPGTLEGNNGSGKAGYTGPCPPKGGAPHHYQFTLYSLDAPLILQAGKTKDDLEQALGSHVLAKAQLTGLFGH